MEFILNMELPKLNYLFVVSEMNREIASTPEKSEVDFCARRTAAVSRQRRRTVHTPPDWLLKRVYGAERGKREKTARRLGARALNVCMLEWPGAPRACRLCLLLPQQSDNGRAAWQSPFGRKFLLYTQINGFSNLKLLNPNSKSQPKPEEGKININDFRVAYWYRCGSRSG